MTGLSERLLRQAPAGLLGTLPWLAAAGWLLLRFERITSEEREAVR